MQRCTEPNAEVADGSSDSSHKKDDMLEKLITQRSKNMRRGRGKPSIIDQLSITEQTSNSWAEGESIGVHNKEEVNESSSRRPRPVRLGELRYVNYNRQTQNCSLHRALDAAFECGKPILAHFCAPGDADQDDVVAELFSDPRLMRVIEECFVPAVFNIEACSGDSEVLRYMRKWFQPHPDPIRLMMLPTQPQKHRLRIITHDGERAVGPGSDDLVTDRECLADILVHALHELHRHVPKTLCHSSVKSADEVPRVRKKLEP